MSDGSWKFACPSHQGFVGTIQGLQVHALMVLTFSTQELEFFFLGGKALQTGKDRGVFEKFHAASAWDEKNKERTPHKNNGIFQGISQNHLLKSVSLSP